MTRLPPLLKRLLWPLCIVLVLVAASRARVEGYATKSCLLHDEVIALMSGACHQGDYERARFDLANHWVPASDWKGLLTTKQFACFGRIRSDLADYDIHPPLFFWLLHLSGIVGGFGSTTGARLNTVLHAVSLLALMVLARRLTSSIWAAIAVAALWTFSTVALDTTFFARQYELLGCLGILTVLAVYGTLTTEKRPRLYAVAVACAVAGMTLTQWYGLIGSVYVGMVVVVLAVIARWRSLKGKEPLRVATRYRLLAAAWAGAQVLALVGHPRIISHFRESSQSRLHPGTEGFLERLDQTAQTLGGFFGFSRGDRMNAAAFIALAMFIAVVVVPAWQWWRAVRAREPADLERALPDAFVALAIPLFAAVAVFAFLAGIGSTHSMSARYVSLFWPMWALGLAWAFCGAISWIRPAAPRLWLASVGTLGLFGWSYAHRGDAAAQCVALCGGDSNVSKTLPLVRAVVTDNTHRGTFGQIIPFIRDDAKVFAFPTVSTLPDRPPAGPVDKRELVRGLRRAGAVSIFHHTAYGLPPHAPDDIRHALDAAGLTLAQMSDWPFALPGIIVLVTYNASKPGQGPLDALDQIARRGSALSGFGDVEGYAAVLVDGKVEKEIIAHAGDATLTASDVAIPLKDFRIVSGKKHSSIRVGQDEYNNFHPGFLALLYDPTARRVVYRIGFPSGRGRPRAWSDLAVRMP